MSQYARADRSGKLLGVVELSPHLPVVAGQMGTWTLIYTVGEYGIDEGGTIKLAHRFASDWQPPQFDQPGESGYTTISTSGNAKLAVRYDRKGHHRPWLKCIVIDVYDGSLAPGDTVTIVLGDTSGGGPGIRAQTFQESAHCFQFFVDPTNACQAQPLPDCPAVPIVPGEAVSLVLTLPSQAKLGEQVGVHLLGQDPWSNPASISMDMKLRWDGTAQAAVSQQSVIPQTPGWGRVIAHWKGNEYASNPICISDHHQPYKRWWGDLHAQTDATVGTGTEEEYFLFARDVARLDFASHQGNDFQMTDANWRTLNETVRQFHLDGSFVVFPGYEWSANTTAGGDRNVFYLEEDMPIIRSSPWQVESGQASSLQSHVPVQALFDALHEQVDPDKVLCGSHVGGRYADLSKGFDEKLGPLIEVVSCWGVFEWLLHDAIDQQLVFGVMANSDGHKGRPGAEGPGAGEFGIAGGLTCVLAPELCRQSIFAALRNRQCYGTTGARIFLDFTINNQPMGTMLPRQVHSLQVAAKVIGTAPIERLLLYQGKQLITEVLAPEFASMQNSRRVRLTWQGSRIRGRGRRVSWDGTLSLKDTRIIEAWAHSFDSPGDTVEKTNVHQVAFTSQTTGDIDGIELLLEDSRQGLLEFSSAAGDWQIDLSKLDDQPQVKTFGGIDMFATLMRYPETIRTMELTLETMLPAPSTPYAAYHIKAIQCDGQTAWSSPIFIR